MLLSAFFSGMDCLYEQEPPQLEIDRKQNRMFDQIAEVFARHPGQYITTILVGNNIALVVYSLSMSLLLRSIYASLGWEQLARSGSVAVDTAVSTVIIIFFAEFLPKSIFRNNPNFYYRALAPVIYFFLHRPLSGGAFHDAAFPTAFCTFWAAASRSGTSPEFRPRGPCGAARLEQPGAAFGTGQRAETLPERAGFRRPARQGLHGSACGRRGRGHRRHLDRTALTARFVDSKYSRIFVWRKSIDNIVGYVNSKAFSRGPGRSPT